MKRERKFAPAEMGRIAFLLIWLLFTIMIIAGFLKTGSNITRYGVNTGKTAVTADTIDKRADGTYSYHIDVSQNAREGEYLLFYTNHQIVEAYADNKLCYTLRASNGIWGHSTGSVWNMFKIPVGTSELSINIRRVYPEIQNFEVQFFAGEPSGMTRSVIMESLAGIITSLAILISGIIFLGYWLCLGEARKKTLAVFYFSVFTCIIRDFVSEENAKALCNVVLETRFHYGDGEELCCSAAAGFARYQRTDGGMNVTRSRADEMMYANKNKMKEQE